MSNRVKRILLPIELFTFLAAVALLLLFRAPQQYSESERRVLATAPQLTFEDVVSAKYMNQMEDYLLDQFPMRDAMRTVKALVSKDILRKRDNNKIYLVGKDVSKMEYPLSYPMLEYAKGRFENIYQMYLEPIGIRPYMVIVPDKNYYLASAHGYLAMDYAAMEHYMAENLPYMQQIDVKDQLTIENFYDTDTHWKQETILPVAHKIADAMGVPIEAAYEEQTLQIPFYGVYVGQSALPLSPDTIVYLTSDATEHCIVTNYDTGKAKQGSVYNLEKAKGRDTYDLFLEGASALIVIENADAHTDRELVMFRDSYGSSLAPLFIPGYRKITLVDLRYLQPSVIGMFVDFTNADVLFEYSSAVLNNSLGLN